MKLPVFLKLTNTDPFAAWYVVTGDVTPDGIRVVRSVLGALSSLLIVTFRSSVFGVFVSPPSIHARVHLARCDKFSKLLLPWTSGTMESLLLSTSEVHLQYETHTNMFQPSRPHTVTFLCVFLSDSTSGVQRYLAHKKPPPPPGPP